MPQARRTKMAWMAAAAVFLAAAGGWAAYRAVRVEPPVQLWAARAAYLRKDFAAAEQDAVRALEQHPDSGEARLLAAHAAAASRRPADALAYLDAWPGGDAALTTEARMLAAESLLALGRGSQAEARLREVLAADPVHLLALRRLASLLTVQGRRWESATHLFALLKARDITAEELTLLGDLWPGYVARDEQSRLRQQSADDLVPLLSSARDSLALHRPQQAEVWLRQVVAAHPDLFEAQAWLGWTLLEGRQDAAFLDWHARLPDGADSHPMIWVNRGVWAERAGQRRAAIRCFLEAARLEPNYAFATQQLARLLELEEPALAPPFEARTRLLLELRVKLLHLHSVMQENNPRSSRQPQYVRQVIELLLELGRAWEVHAWCHVLQALSAEGDDNRRFVAETLRELEPDLAGGPPQTLPAAQPALAIDVDQFPLPEFGSGTATAEVVPPTPRHPPQIRFADIGRESGIQFSYVNGERPAQARTIVETVGGGVAVLDYDADGWPDLFFTQGGRLPPDPQSPAVPDALYRNLGGRQFVDVAAAAGLADDRYGQGVAVGDIDGDGFADLFVANLGGNRLLRNNGDGTFSEWTDLAHLSSTGWTTSCAIADLTGDGLPDLYEANYCAGDDVVHRICSVGGKSRTCLPFFFPPDPDRFYVNLGHGGFEERLAASGMEAPSGYGLGLVAADTDGSGRLSLLVANDGTPNFYFANVTSAGGSPQFVERAASAGLAVDGRGVAQACMGVAADDADGNGALDLFVTNFHNESNTLYLQDAAGHFFVDGTAGAGLQEPSLSMLGFGTQFVDADLDGWPDLIVANGHVEDFNMALAPSRMRAQLFYNLGAGQFVEIPARDAGEYFERELFGRGMARLDWNRDGREEVAISNMNDPAALLRNDTESHGHFLAVRLVGTASDRDAIGTVLRARVGERTITKQLTAGDGFQASNERQIVFGLGEAQQVDELHVRWPGGQEQQFTDLAADAHLVLIEGAVAPAVQRIVP
jgi:tetratricopeptide (TPR) repeat protein